MQLISLFYWFAAFWAATMPVSKADGTPADASICACNRMADSLILVEFYNAAGGSNWSNSWQLNMPVNQWYGVV